jgi:hypothetical protein
MTTKVQSARHASAAARRGAAWVSPDEDAPAAAGTVLAGPADDHCDLYR